MMGFTGIFYYYLTNRPLITADKFPEDFENLDGVMLNKWWDSYTHPLIARGSDGLLQNTSDQSFTHSRSRRLTDKGQNISRSNSIKNKDSQTNHPVLRIEEDLDDLSHDIMAGSFVGAKPKTFKTKQSLTYPILTEKLGSSYIG